MTLMWDHLRLQGNTKIMSVDMLIDGPEMQHQCYPTNTILGNREWMSGNHHRYAFVFNGPAFVNEDADFNPSPWKKMKTSWLYFKEICQGRPRYVFFLKFYRFIFIFQCLCHILLSVSLYLYITWLIYMIAYQSIWKDNNVQKNQN